MRKIYLAVLLLCSFALFLNASNVLSAGFTTDHVANAAGNVKSHVGTNHALPFISIIEPESSSGSWNGQFTPEEIVGMLCTVCGVQIDPAGGNDQGNAPSSVVGNVTTNAESQVEIVQPETCKPETSQADKDQVDKDQTDKNQTETNQDNNTKVQVPPVMMQSDKPETATNASRQAVPHSYASKTNRTTKVTKKQRPVPNVSTPKTNPTTKVTQKAAGGVHVSTPKIKQSKTTYSYTPKITRNYAPKTTGGMVTAENLLNSMTNHFTTKNGLVTADSLLKDMYNEGVKRASKLTPLPKIKSTTTSTSSDNTCNYVIDNTYDYGISTSSCYDSGSYGSYGSSSYGLGSYGF